MLNSLFPSSAGARCDVATPSNTTSDVEWVYVEREDRAFPIATDVHSKEVVVMQGLLFPVLILCHQGVLIRGVPHLLRYVLL